MSVHITETCDGCGKAREQTVVARSEWRRWLEKVGLSLLCPDCAATAETLLLEQHERQRAAGVA